MKKIALVLSVAAASSLMAANIDIYGVGHISMDSIDNGTDSTAKVASNSSRIGIKARHDLGNGITLIGQYESGADLSGQGTDDGNGGQNSAGSTLFTNTRDSYLGVKTEFGTLLAGRLPGVNQWMYDYNLFADQVGDLGNIWGPAGIGIDRANDTVAYFIPDIIEGLSGDLAYMSDQSGTNDGNSNTGVLIKLNYEISGLKVGIGYLQVTDDTDVVFVENPSDLAITASYATDMFSIGAGYVKSGNAGGSNEDRNSYTLGGSYRISAITLKAQYAAVSDDVDNADANMITVGVDYAMHDDTTVYIAYAATGNDDAATYKSNNWGHGKSSYGTPTAGEDPSAISLGLVYKFGGTVYGSN